MKHSWGPIYDPDYRQCWNCGKVVCIKWAEWKQHGSTEECPARRKRPQVTVEEQRAEAERVIERLREYETSHSVYVVLGREHTGPLLAYIDALRLLAEVRQEDLNER